MSFLSSLSTDHLQRYSRIIQQGIQVRGHFDLLRWLQGEVQHYLPHEIMLAAWGDFGSNFICYDIVSSLPGVRTAHLGPVGLSPLLRRLHKHWVEMGRMPCSDVGPGILHAQGILQCAFGGVLQGMRSSLLHGISDKRGRHDCLYVVFSSKDELNSSMLTAMEVLLPYLDIALRRVEPLSHRPGKGRLRAGSQESEAYRLSQRESEIMDWVKIGKTNDEIGTILSISSHTVKNHIQHIFKKLDVYNRLQAISKLERSPLDLGQSTRSKSRDASTASRSRFKLS